jgi:UDP-galactopyranose mutase
METQWLIVGAGFTGSVLAERIAKNLNQKVLIIDKRDHIGGDAYDFTNEYGHIIHKYGPHVLYINNQNIYKYLSKFADWIPYQYKARAAVDGKLIPIPFNLESLYFLFQQNIASEMESLLKEHYGLGKAVPVLKLRSHHCKRLAELGNIIYDKIYSPYTKKNVGMCTRGARSLCYGKSSS